MSITIAPIGMDTSKSTEGILCQTVDEAVQVLNTITDQAKNQPETVDQIFAKYPGLGEIMNNPKLSPHQKKLRSLPFIRKLSDEQGVMLARHHELTEDAEALEALVDWWQKPMKLEKNDCSRLHKFVAAVTTGKVILSNGNGFSDTGFKWKELQTFVVQHDWASAFEHATDYAEGPYNIPYEHCAFEFRIAGRNVVILAAQENEQPTPALIPFIDFDTRWICPSDEIDQHDAIKLGYGQVKAICIALDAEVATRAVVRAPEKLNRHREQEGKLPLYSYHVVSLNRRIRVANPASSGVTQARKRLHFRRGHWRHFAESKTWVRWTLVGDPELGFIDKEYRL